MATEVAKAYVQIVPSAQGISGKISEALGGEVEKEGERGGSAFSKAFGTAMKATAGLVTAGAAAIGKVAGDAIAGFADYEQLVGGVETLFKGSAGVVQEYAANAYKTAGLSANQYMETVTSFSASLLQSLGGDTEKAAQYGDMAITDMADNANKMGTSMEAVQNAYQGFAKQNYTMLDNLKLGYGGTKTEMERLLADASELSGVEYDIDNLSDVYEAIHVIQGELGITGTTAIEAGETISGSVASVKAAWQNLLVGVADGNADLGGLTNNLVTSIQTAARNILPVLTQTLSGISSLVSGLAPVIASAIPTLVADVLPSVISSATSLVETLGFALLDNLPLIVDTGIMLLITLANSFSDTIPELIPRAVDAVIAICDSLMDNLDMLIDSALAIILALSDGLTANLPKLLKAVPVLVGKLVAALIDKAPDLLLAAAELIGELLVGLVEGGAQLIQGAWDMVTTIVGAIGEKISEFLTVGSDIVAGIWQGISDGITWIKEKIKGWVGNVLDFVKGLFGIGSPSKVFAEYGKFLDQGLGNGIADNTGYVSDAMSTLAAAANDDFGATFSANVVGTSGAVTRSAMARDVSAAGAVNGLMSGLQAQAGQPIVIEMRLADGTLLAMERAMLPGLINVARSAGTPITNPA